MSANYYVTIIMNDDAEKIVRETPTAYENARIEREYEFEDGAVVRYEWQDISAGGFNHRFTLIKAPSPNPKRLVPGVIRSIEY